MKKILLLSSFMAILWVAMSFSVLQTEKGKLIINIVHLVGKDQLKLDSATYKNELGQSFTISNFKYYISNIILKTDDGKEYSSADYFLINEEDADSKKLILKNIPERRYTSLRFTLGVDSAHNCSGAQSGALDPANGMFWAWNTGYIFLKLEGKSPASLSPGHIFEYHIGGYKHPNNFIREINLKLAEPADVSDKKTTRIVLSADVSRVLRSPNIIDFSKLSSITDFHHASVIADNYTNMFDIVSDTDEK